MDWLNIFGLIFIVIIMIPNIIYAIKCKDGFANKWQNKTVELLEQIGRFGCFGFTIINIPGTGTFDTAFGSIFVQWNYEQVGVADYFCSDFCTVPYFDFV